MSHYISGIKVIQTLAKNVEIEYYYVFVVWKCIRSDERNL